MCYELRARYAVAHTILNTMCMCKVVQMIGPCFECSSFLCNTVERLLTTIIEVQFIWLFYLFSFYLIRFWWVRVWVCIYVFWQWRAMTLHLMCISGFWFAFVHLSIHPLCKWPKAMFHWMPALCAHVFLINLMFGCTEQLTIKQLLFI